MTPDTDTAPTSPADYYARPDITPAQVVAVVQALVALAVAFGLGLTDAQVAALVGTANVLAALLIGGDAAIRRGRSKLAAAEVNAAATVTVAELADDATA